MNLVVTPNTKTAGRGVRPQVVCNTQIVYSVTYGIRPDNRPKNSNRRFGNQINNSDRTTQTVWGP